ncbi:MAG: ATP-dependent DNA helicase RecG [Bacillati bacterium ANGP1]|uniref:ATP-dependent DNA helicase RecG n=1 Tax=Candidatus Segetimicrobium genomatis TaxID=2569760 RepID=A0A537JAM7_9BACT|nr:MAG: ATP-dependent DNA helicase RecG [Terrabacteria group bacterium ANGP1]
MATSHTAPPAVPARAAAAGLETLVQYARGVGPQRARLLLDGLGIATVRDLLYHLPRRLDDRSHLRSIYDLQHGAVETIQGVVGQVRQFRPRRRSLVITKAAITDDSGVLQVVWYNQPYLARLLAPGRRLILHGRVQRRAGEIQMIAPEFEPLDDGEDTLHVGRIVPVYRSTDGLSQRILRRIVFHAIDDYAPLVEEWLPARVRRRHGFADQEAALRQAHFPDTLDAQEQARRRMVYEELFLLQLLLLRQKARAEAEPRTVRYGDAGDLVARFHQGLAFPLTQAQHRAINEIAGDLAGPHPMNRLLQGDVGSGKTVVAASALLRCAGGGAQGALMAPTEILAGQHYLTLRGLLDPLGVTVVLLVGGLGRAARADALQKTRDGTADIVIGTHALIEEDVEFHRLGLVVVDEQHRFGVGQRAALRAKGPRPDVLVMTATPIPRTLALTLYGDLEVSTLDELPPGRSPIKTYARPTARRPQVYEFVRAQVAEGRQAYIVCPLIEESEKLQAEAAVDLAARLSNDLFRGLRVEVLHGRMRVEEREAAMRALRAGEIDILVATTVIEVGIDIPNASVMVIEDADRFGLSQLHQLRGRVGRGAHQAYCILVADPKADDDVTARRLQAMVETTDGFQIAQRDLELRGAGELLGDRRGGGLRQHGVTDLRIANLLRDHGWLEGARRDAREILAQDPALESREHRGMADALRRRFGGASAENARVG